MPYPTKYTRQFDFASYQNSNPTRPLPGTSVNVDLDSVKQSIAEVVEFLKTSIRADGHLANGSVGVNQLDATFDLGFSLPTTWEAGVAYTTDSTVFHDNVFYKANVDHTSTDGFDESKWDVIVDFGEQATAAAAAAAAALVSQNAAAASATASAGSATSSSGSATAASGSATAASGSATTATTQAAAASSSAAAAATSETNAAASYDSFDDRYLGAKASDPTLDNDGAALLTGALYWTTSGNALKVYDGAAWQIFSPTAGDMLKSDNLSGLASPATARTNLGGTAVGTAVFVAASAAAARTAIGASVGIPDVIVEDQKASGTNGGTATSGSFATRTLNTLVRNNGTIATLSANQVTLGAGTYFLRWGAPAGLCGVHQTRLQDVTHTSTSGTGTSEYSGSSLADGSVTRSLGSCVVTIAGSTAFELQHRVTTTRATTGFGAAGSFGTEVYARLEITKLS